jgi:DNA repair photolyase
VNKLSAEEYIVDKDGKMEKKDKAVHGTHEWAASTVNCVVGCSHSCRYCWAKAYAIRSGKKSPNNWAKEIVNMKDVIKKYGKRSGTIMFPANHDITPDTLDMCCTVLERLLSVGNKVLVVSKPHMECIAHICNNFRVYQKQILFRFTIGSASDRVLSFWEPNAPSYLERLASLVLAYKLGYQTSISCEPMLDSRIDRVVSHTLPYVTDAVWLGKANDLINRLKLNGETDSEIMDRAYQLISMQGDYHIKQLYKKFKDNPKVKWKDSIKKVVGIERPTEKGLDV